MSDATWENVAYRVGSRTLPAMTAFVDAAAQQFVNGGCVLRHFEPLDAAAFDAALGRDVRGLGHCLAAFLGRAEVQRALAEIEIPSAKRLPPAHRLMTAFELEGALTFALLGGGAYTHGVGSEERARVLSRQFVDALVAGRRMTCTVFAIEGAWTPWFHDVAWDHSYVLLDRVARAWWTLFLTDTD